MSRRWILFHSLLLATFLAAGFQLVWYVALAVGYQAITSPWPASSLGQILIDPQGDAIVEARTAAGISRRTLKGEPVVVDGNKNWLKSAYLSARLDERWRDATLPWRSRIAEFNVSGPPPSGWFFVHAPTNDGSGYFVGYDNYGKTLLGYLGRRGFRAAQPPADEWFPIAGPPHGRIAGSNGSVGRNVGGEYVISAASLLPKSRVYAVSDGRLWQIDLQRRSVVVLDEGSDDVSVAAATGLPRDSGGSQSGDTATAESREYPNKGLLVRRGAEIAAVDYNGRQRLSWRLPAEFRTEPFFWYELADGAALIQSEQRYNGVAWFNDLHWIDQQGRVTGSERVEISGASIEIGAWHFLGIVAVAPDVLVAAPAMLLAAPLEAVSQGWQPNYPTALAHVLVEAWPALVLLCALSAALAFLAYRRQARYALPGPAAWAAFVFLFGVPGWLAHRWHRRWPVLEACGECGRAAPRDRGACAVCGRVFAPPPLTGTEIFA